MIFQVTMKCPDALDDAIEDATSGMEARDAVSEINDIKRICQQWFEYDEYITVEIDTVKNTCVVLKKG